MFLSKLKDIMITYLFIKYFLLHLKYWRLLKNIYKEENLIDNLSKLFNVEFRIDWLGRIYAIFNPHIQNGMFEQNNQIYEYTENGLTNESYVKSYIMSRLNIADRFIRANNLFDLLTYKLKKIDNYDNYLFIIQPITLDDCLTAVKRFLIMAFVIMILSVIYVCNGFEYLINIFI